VVIAENISADGFELGKSLVQKWGLNLHLGTALPAEQVMMITRGEFVYEVPRSQPPRPNQAVVGQKLQCAVHGGLCQSRKYLASPLVYLDWRKVPA
jgi:hypothetical protein